MEGLVFDIRHFSVHDGPGIRTTVFLKGCPLRCAWCHNPESQLFEPEPCVKIHKLDGKEFRLEEIVGKQMPVGDVLAEVKKDIAIYDESGGGVTFSGGEPLSQPEYLQLMLEACKHHEIHTAVDTCGFVSRPALESIIPFTDLFLYDLKLASNDEHVKYTGVPNGVILDNLNFIAHSGKKVVARIPLIQDITDTESNLKMLRQIIAQYPSIERVDVLPFHNIAKSKYERLGKKYTLSRAESYSAEKALQIKNYFLELIPSVSIGG